MGTPENDMMNCDEYRKTIAADPTSDSGADHASGCADCRQYRDEMRALDAGIARALHIAVPPLEMPALPEVRSGDVVSLSSRKTPAKATWFALAAGMVLAAVIGFRMSGPGVEYALADQVLAHVDHEPFALTVSSVPVSDARLAAVVPADIGQMNHDAGLITYARSCPINGNAVPHLVIQGERGPVTILLMPEEPVDGPVTFEDETSHGVILPVGDGSIAIIAPHGEELERIEKNILDSVAWST